jgi:hypothetical protein
MRRRSILLVVAALSSSAFVNVAHADTKRLRDGNDVRGPLDIRAVAHGHRTASDGSTRLVHTVRLRRAWPVAKLGKDAYLVVSIDLRGHRRGRPERTLQIESEHGKLVARMYDTLAKPEDHLGRVALWQPDRRTLRFSFPGSLLRDGLRRYRWRLATVVENHSRMCRPVGVCVDWAPDQGDRRKFVRHVL